MTRLSVRLVLVCCAVAVLAYSVGYPCFRGIMASRQLTQGEVDCDRGRYREAIEHFDASIAWKPASAAAFHGRGKTRMKLGRPDLAAGDFDVAIRLAPRVGEYYLSRGNLRANRGDLGRAIDDCSEAIRLDPDNREAQGQLQTCKLRLAGKATSTFLPLSVGKTGEAPAVSLGTPPGLP